MLPARGKVITGMGASLPRGVVVAVVLALTVLAPSARAGRLRGRDGRGSVGGSRALLQQSAVVGGEGFPTRPTAVPGLAAVAAAGTGAGAGAAGLEPETGAAGTAAAAPGSRAVFDKLKGTARSLGLGFLLSFAETALPASRDVAEDLPTAANYLYRLLARGLDHNLKDPYGPAAGALYDILQTVFSHLAGTPTGGYVVDVIMSQHTLDLPAILAARNMPQLLRALRRSYWFPEWSRYFYVTYYSAKDQLLYGSLNLVNSATYVMSTLVRESMSPYGRLHPVTLASDVVHLLGSLADRTVGHSDTLRYNADAALRMTDDEYNTFVRLQSNLDELRRSLAELSGEVDERGSVVLPPPPYGPSWPPASYGPSWPPAPSQPPLAPPYSWDFFPFPPSPSRPPAFRSRLENLVRRTAESLGLDFLLSFVQRSYRPVADIAYYVPYAAGYVMRLLESGLDGQFTDSHGLATSALLRILRSAISAWPATPTGDIIADALLRNHNIDLRALGSVNNWAEALVILRRAFLNRYRSNEADYGAWDVTYSVSGIIRQLVYETTSPYGRLSSLQLTRDVVELSYAFVNAVVANGDDLRYGAYRTLAMSSNEYDALYMIQNSLRELRLELGSLSDNLTHLDLGSSDPGDWVPAPAPQPQPHNYTDYYGDYYHPSSPPLPSTPTCSCDGGGSWSPPYTRSPSASPSPSSSPSEAPLDSLLRLLGDTVDDLGLHFLAELAKSAYPPAADIAADSPTAAHYFYKLIKGGLGPYLSDPAGPAAESLHYIARAALAQLTSSLTGSVVVDVVLTNHDLELGSLAAARNLAELLSSLRSNTRWWTGSAWVDTDLAGPAVVQTITDIVRQITWEAASPSGRLGPLQLSSDVVSLSRAVVGAVLERADTLRNTADAALYMSDQEYGAFLRLQDSLAELSASLDKLAAHLPSSKNT